MNPYSPLKPHNPLSTRSISGFLFSSGALSSADRTKSFPRLCFQTCSHPSPQISCKGLGVTRSGLSQQWPHFSLPLFCLTFPVVVEKTPRESNSETEGLVLTYSSVLWLIMMGRTQQRDLEAPEGAKEGMLCSASFLLCIQLGL